MDQIKIVYINFRPPEKVRSRDVIEEDKPKQKCFAPAIRLGIFNDERNKTRRFFVAGLNNLKTLTKRYSAIEDDKG